MSSLAEYLAVVLDLEPSLQREINPGLHDDRIVSLSRTLRTPLKPELVEWFQAANGSNVDLFAAGRLVAFPEDATLRAEWWREDLELAAPGGPRLIAPVVIVDTDHWWLLTDLSQDGADGVWLFSEDGLEHLFETVDEMLGAALELLEVGWVSVAPGGVRRSTSVDAGNRPNPRTPLVDDRRSPSALTASRRASETS